MKHEHRFRKLSRSPEHRSDLLRTMLAQLIIYEQIVTTNPKAKEVAKRAEKVMALARRNTPAARESAYSKVFQQSIVLPKLFGELRFRYRDRSKDFTRIWLYGYRQNDRGARAMIELVDSPKDTQSLFAIEYLPKLRKDLDLIRLKLIAAQRTKEPDAYKRHLLRKEIMELEGKERFFERLITRLEYSLQDKKRADESRVDWAKWEVNHEVKAKKAVMDDIRTKLEVYGRLGGHMDDADLRRLIETRKYDGAHQARISWDDWTAYLAGGEETVKPNEKSTRLLEEMLSRQREGLRMMEEVVGDAAAAGGSVPAATTSTATAAEGEKSDEGASDGDKKRAGGSSLFSRLLGLGGQR